MRLFIINEAGYARTYGFNYDPSRSHDNKPRLLLLGKWRHPDTRNQLLAGINLNYASPDEILQIRQNLPAILAPRNLKSRYWKGMELLPDVFGSKYRTYDRNFVIGGSITRDTLKFYPTPEELERAEAESAVEKELAAKGHDIKKPTKVPKAIEPVSPEVKPELEPTVEVPAEPKIKPKKSIEPVSKKIDKRLAEPETAPETSIEPEEKPIEPETPTTMEPEAKPESETPIERGEKTAPTVEPEMEETPIKKQRARAQVGKKPKKTKPTSAQRRKQARDIKKALEKQKLEAPPPPLPPPPEEIKGVLGMFKKKK